MVFKFLPHSRLISPPCQPCEVQDMLFSQFDYEKIEVRDGRSAQGHKQCLFGVGVEIIFYFAFKIRAELRTTVSWFPVSQICWVPNWATGPQGPMTSPRLEQQVFQFLSFWSIRSSSTALYTMQSPPNRPVQGETRAPDRMHINFVCKCSLVALMLFFFTVIWK